jgi:hypothetical protein
MVKALVSLAALTALLLSLALVPDSAKAQSSRNENGAALVWPEIPWIAGADFAEFDRTIAQSRDGVRKELTHELIEMLTPMVDSGAAVEDVLGPLFQALLSFDKLHKQHMADASRGLGVSLEALLQAEVDGLYRLYDIKPEERHAKFARAAEFALVDQLRANPNSLSAQQRSWLAAHIQYVSFGTWTVAAPGVVLLTLTMEDLVTGERVTFEARGQIEEAVRTLAGKVFSFFQEMTYEGWKNPQPQLEWIAPSRATPVVLPALAEMYCKSQNARLPYSRELFMAMQGSEFKPGGIPAAQDGEVWSIADRRFWDEPYFYFAGQEDVTGGLLRTSAGQARLMVRYWCVRGKPARETVMIEDLYRAIRRFLQTKDQLGVSAALRVLRELGDAGQDWHAYPEPMADLDRALTTLRSKGLAVTL